MMLKSTLLHELEKLKQPHSYCDDSWYTCPMRPEGCADDRQKGCNCGADWYNERLHTLIEQIQTEGVHE